MSETAPTDAADSGRIKLPANVVQLLFAALVSLALGGGLGTRIGADALSAELKAQGVLAVTQAAKADAAVAELKALAAKLEEVRESLLELKADRSASAATILDLKAQVAEIRAQVRALEIALARKEK